MEKQQLILGTEIDNRISEIDRHLKELGLYTPDEDGDADDYSLARWSSNTTKTNYITLTKNQATVLRDTLVRLLNEEKEKLQADFKNL